MTKIASSGKLLSEEAQYFAKHLLLKLFQTPQFYGMPKVHTDKLPVPLRPAVRQSASLLAVASTYVDYTLQLLIKNLHSYTTNSQQIVNEIFGLVKLSAHTKLFTSDTENM